MDDLKQFFEFEQLPEHLKDISRRFSEIADFMDCLPATGVHNNDAKTTRIKRLCSSVINYKENKDD